MNSKSTAPSVFRCDLSGGYVDVFTLWKFIKAVNLWFVYFSCFFCLFVLVCFFFFFLPLQSRDPRKDQRTEYLVEGEWVLPLKGRYPPSHFQICKVSWQRLETWLTKEAEFHWDRWTVRILYLHLLWWNVVRKREEIRHFESVFLKSQVTDDKSSQTSPTIHI